jgi:hypothetical protein
MSIPTVLVHLIHSESNVLRTVATQVVGFPFSLSFSSSSFPPSRHLVVAFVIIVVIVMVDPEETAENNTPSRRFPRTGLAPGTAGVKLMNVPAFNPHHFGRVRLRPDCSKYSAVTNSDATAKWTWEMGLARPSDLPVRC